MGGHLLKLGLLLLSMACSSSTNSFNQEMETSSAETLPISTMNSLPVSLHDNSLGNKEATLNNTSAKKLITSHGSSKESNVTLEKETNLAGETTQEETSTFPVLEIAIRPTTRGPVAAALIDSTPDHKGADALLEDPLISNTSAKEPKVTPVQETSPAGETTQEKTSTPKGGGPLAAPLEGNTPSNNATTFIVPLTKGPTMFHASTKEPKVTSKQDTSPDGVTSQEKTSTEITTGSATTKDPSLSNLSPKPANVTIPSHGPFTSQEDDGYETTSTGEMPESPKSLLTQAPDNNNQGAKDKASDDSNKKKLVLIVVIMVILVLILITVVVILVRNKRRSGSQNFHRKSSKRQDVWAGQVPELGEGKMMQHPMGAENGTAGNKPEPGQEQEMITFTTAEKKDDSVVEVNELSKGGASEEEKKPLLEDTSQMKEEPEKPPVQEDIPAPTVEQQLV
ncbi:uncharacterized protein [Dendropsophus ebraccatus]|uniref:uncharacterized protein n=1 Tax=Dendropsophus ebraccatus TaxID=150705 RepID=UPI003831D0B7